MGKKKQRKGAPDLDDDFPEPPETDKGVDVDTSDVQASAPKKQDKKKKAKKGKAKDSGWGSDDEAAALPEAKAEEAAAAPASKQTARKQVASAFDLLEGSDVELEEVAPAANDGFDAEMNGAASEPDSAADSDSDSDLGEQGGLVVAEVISVKAHPKADRLRVCSVDYGHDVAQVVTNAANVAEGMKVIFAGEGVKVSGPGTIISKTAVRGVDSFGMLCSAYDIGWSNEADGALVIMPDDAQPGDPCPADAPKALPKSKKAAKKSKAGRAGDFSADLDDPELQAEADLDQVPAAAPKRKGKKQHKDSKAALDFAALDDDEHDDDTIPIVPDTGDSDDEKPEAVSVLTAKKGKKQKAASSASAFAALGVDSDAEGVDDSEDAHAPVTKAKSKKSKKKTADASSSFAALDVESDDAPANGDIKEAEAEADAVLKSRPKSGRKKQTDATAAFAALGLDDDDESAAPAPSADDVAAAEDDATPRPARKGKKSKKAAVDTASAFAALGLEDDDAADGGDIGVAAQPDEDNAFAGKSKGRKKSKKKAADLDSVFAALDQNGTSENGDANTGTTRVDAMTNGTQPDVEADEAAAFGKKKKKSSRQKGDQAVTGDAELDALMEEIGGEPVAAAAQQEDEEQQPASKAKKKKKGKAAAADTEDIDALLAQLDGPPEQQQTATSSELAAAAESPAKAEAEPAGKGKKKKKKGKASAKDEEDLDAVLAELGMAPAATPEAQPTTDAQPQVSHAAPADEAAAAPAADGAAEEDNDAAAAEDGKEMTAAEKKKAKKKAREKAKKAGGDADDAAAPAAAKKGGKKVSAAVRKMQEEVEARQRAEAEAARLAEEQRIREEEEERQREEEERQKKEGSERRKAERLERRAQLKREGKLLTGKAKKEAERLAAVREQFLKQAGMDAPGADEEDKPAAKKKVVYGKKKPQAKPKAAEGEAQPSTAGASEAAEAQAAAEASTAAAQAQAEEAKAQAQHAEEAQQQEEAEARDVVESAVDKSQGSSEDDWEDNWERMDAVPAIGPAAEQAKQKAAEGDAKRPLEGGVDAPAAKKPETESAQAGKAADKATETESEEESGSGEESNSEDDSDEDSDEESSSEYSSSEEDSEEEAERRLQAAKDQRQARLQAAMAAGSKEVLRSPICCILGHVDTGKTKILDNVRRTNVQDGEAGGITQQIGATYVPGDALLKRTQALRANGEESTLKLPGLLIIDTPGHESFSNLRSRGSSLCDIAILVVDMMHGLEQQTIESINLLKMRKTPFVVALNKIDRLFDWKAQTDAPIQQSLNSQQAHVKREFDERLKQSVLNLNEQGLNVALYWQNPDKRKYVNVVPTSAITGEGLPDMLQLLVDLTQSMMASRLMVISETQCTVLEVKVIEGLGTTIDVVLVNGVLHEGDTIVLCGMGGPIVTQIRSLLTPHPLKELRVRGSYLHHKEIKAAQGVKIAAQNLESAVAGTQMLVAGPTDDINVLKAEVMEDMKDIFGSVDRSGEGVCVQASTLGSLEALLEFLKSPAVKIPVSGINIGPVHKKDVMRASVMLEKGRHKFACLLAFDVPVTREAREMAESLGVKIFTADIIYHLFDQFTAYLKTVKDEEQEAAKFDAVFPCILRIIPGGVFNKKDPIIVGVDVEEGIAKVGTPICIPSQGGIEIGRIASMELNHKPVDTAKRGDAVAMKIEPHNATEATRLFGRHFTEKDLLVSKISRKSIELLKKHFMDDMTRDDWRLVVKLKKTFQID